MIMGCTKNRNSSIRSVPISEWTRLALLSIRMSLPGCCFSLVIASHDIACDNGQFFPGSCLQRGRDHIFFHAVKFPPRALVVRSVDQNGQQQFIGGPSQEVHIASGGTLEELLFASRRCHKRIPPLIHRFRVEDCHRGSSTPSQLAFSCAFSFHSIPSRRCLMCFLLSVHRSELLLRVYVAEGQNASGKLRNPLRIFAC